MARRTNKELVEGVLAGGGDYRRATQPDLEPYIRVGQNKIDQLVTDCATFGIDVPSADVLQDLETWISAWAYKNSDQQYASSSARSSASFKGQTGMGLESNHYGQTALEMDPTGLLQQKTKAVVSAAWTGRRPSEQTDYVDRN